jgi:hypothetical protein
LAKNASLSASASRDGHTHDAWPQVSPSAAQLPPGGTVQTMQLASPTWTVSQRMISPSVLEQVRTFAAGQLVPATVPDGGQESGHAASGDNATESSAVITIAFIHFERMNGSEPFAGL